MPSLKSFCKAVGWSRLRRWAHAINKVKELEAHQDQASVTQPPSSKSTDLGPFRLDLQVTWTGKTIGVDDQGNRRLWADGSVKGDVLSKYIRLWPKRQGHYHLVFLAKPEPFVVYINGELIGVSQLNSVPASEWTDYATTERHVKASRIVFVGNHDPRVQAIAKIVGETL